MPRVTVSEYSNLPEDFGARSMPMTGKATYSKKYVPVAGQPLKVLLVNPDTRFVRIATDVDIHVAQDEDATEDHPYLPAGCVEPMGVREGFISILMVGV